MIFLDTNIAIDLRDAVPGIEQRVVALAEQPVLSFVTRIELEGGVYRDPARAFQRRALLDRLLQRFQIVPLTEKDAASYGRIIADSGFDRRRILDRLIAAQAVTRNASLVTANTDDFANIPGLHLIPW